MQDACEHAGQFALCIRNAASCVRAHVVYTQEGFVCTQLHLCVRV